MGFNYGKFERGGDAMGTSLQGYVDVSYVELVEVFGESNMDDGDDYKMDAHWTLTFVDGTVATIYNYKDGVNYKGKKGTPTEKITDWHVGGNSEHVVRLVNLALGR